MTSSLLSGGATARALPLSCPVETPGLAQPGRRPLSADLPPNTPERRKKLRRVVLEGFPAPISYCLRPPLTGAPGILESALGLHPRRGRALLSALPHVDAAAQRGAGPIRRQWSPQSTVGRVDSAPGTPGSGPWPQALYRPLLRCRSEPATAPLRSRRNLALIPLAGSSLPLVPRTCQGSATRWRPGRPAASATALWLWRRA